MPYPAFVRPLRALLPLLAAGVAGAAPLDPALVQRVQQFAQAGASAVVPPGARVAVELGQLDPRLRLAACAEVEPYLPLGLQSWGRSRVGLRCMDGKVRWNVTVPMVVHVFARVLVAKGPLPVDTVLTQDQFETAEIDIAAQSGAVFTDASTVVGRTLVRPLEAGEALRQTQLKARMWFTAGETVQVQAKGSGYSVSTEGQAMSPGLEGQEVRVRVDSGRVIVGRAVGDRRVEIAL